MSFRRFTFLIAISLLAVFAFPLLAFACLPRPFGPDGTTVTLSGKSQALLVYEKDGTEHLIIDPNLKGDAKDFGLMLAFPTQPKVSEAPKDIFEELNEFTKPRYRPIPVQGMTEATRGEGSIADRGPKALPPVEVKEIKEVGDFIVSILIAREAQALLDWLRENNYQSNETDLQNFDYYIQKNKAFPPQIYYFAALKVSTKKAGKVITDYDLSPIRFTFKSEFMAEADERGIFAVNEPYLPLRLAHDNDPIQDFTLYTLGEYPIEINGAGIVYKNKIESDGDIQTLEDFDPEGKWFTRMEMTINPSKIEKDLFLNRGDSLQIHIFEDEDPVVVPGWSLEREGNAGIMPYAVGASYDSIISVPDVVYDHFPSSPWWRVESGKFVIIGFFLLLHFYTAFAFFIIAKKLSASYCLLAWIPVANWYLLIRMAEKPWWWFLFLILLPFSIVGLFLSGDVWAVWFEDILPPILNIPLILSILLPPFFLLYMLFSSLLIVIAKKRGRPTWWGHAIVIFPPLGLVLLGLLAWKEVKSQ